MNRTGSKVDTRVRSRVIYAQKAGYSLTAIFQENAFAMSLKDLIGRNE